MEQQSAWIEQEERATKAMHRRKFLGIMGGSAAAVAVVAACNNNDPVENGPYDGAVVEPDGVTINLGRGDVGILNYAYALEQLESAFYTKVVTDSVSVFSADEIAFITDIRDHEIAHREYFKTIIATKAIPALEVDFSSINFGDRTSVLSTAKTFEDLGVSAYNGAGQLIADTNYLLAAGKIVSVEARHAAYIADLISNGTFADTVTPANGLDQINTPTAVLTAASGFLKTKITGKDLPTS